MIDNLSGLETKILIHVICLSLIAVLIFALSLVALVFEILNRRSRNKRPDKNRVPRHRNPLAPPQKNTIK